jgi:hypothetical protein
LGVATGGGAAGRGGRGGRDSRVVEFLR